MQPQWDLSLIAPRAIVIMGVSGSGKSTVGALLAEKLRCRFLDGDDYHLPASIEKMRAGRPLTDEDRWPWLDRLGAAMDAAVAADGLSVAACSALKRSYRERLRDAVGAPVSFVLLRVGRDELARRLNNRPGHFMAPSLLSSQLEALEAPGTDEFAVDLDAGLPPEGLCAMTWAWLESVGVPPAAARPRV